MADTDKIWLIRVKNAREQDDDAMRDYAFAETAEAAVADFKERMWGAIGPGDQIAVSSPLEIDACFEFGPWSDPIG